MSFLLDTNVASEWTTPRPDRGFVESGTPIVPPPALAVAGPTASGKSALALELAERLRGTIINADAMQVYRELRILTARPRRRRSPRPARASTASGRLRAGQCRVVREAALVEMDGAREAGRLPILTGGSGLYFAALTDGLAAIPEPVLPRATKRAPC